MFAPVACDARFQLLLEPVSPSSASTTLGISDCVADSTVYGLWPDLRLAAFDSGWVRFAQANGGEPAISTEWPLGRCILDAIAEPLRPFFSQNYAKCLREGRPWEHVYECSSATVRREMHMIAYPLKDAAGVVVFNTKRRESLQEGPAKPPLTELYRQKSGVMTQCAHCRRMRRVDIEEHWEWVPEWVEHQPEGISHGLCKPCQQFHYSPDKMDDDSFRDSFLTGI